MTHTTKPISTATYISGKIRYTLSMIADALGKKGAIFTAEEPGKEIDEVFLTEDQLKALKYLTHGTATHTA